MSDTPAATASLDERDLHVGLRGDRRREEECPGHSVKRIKVAAWAREVPVREVDPDRCERGRATTITNDGSHRMPRRAQSSSERQTDCTRRTREEDHCALRLQTTRHRSADLSSMRE